MRLRTQRARGREKRFLVDGADDGMANGLIVGGAHGGEIIAEGEDDVQTVELSAVGMEREGERFAFGRADVFRRLNGAFEFGFAAADGEDIDGDSRFCRCPSDIFDGEVEDFFFAAQKTG